MVRSAQATPAGNNRRDHFDHRRALCFLCCRLHRSSSRGDQPSYLVRFPTFGDAVCRLGGVDLGGIDDLACRAQPLDHARHRGFAPDGRLGPRAGTHRLDRVLGLARAGFPRLVQCLGPGAVARRCCLRNARAAIAIVAQGLARRSQYDHRRPRWCWSAAFCSG